MDGVVVHHRVTPSIKFASTHLYTWVERGTVKVKCLAQEHNTMSLARARTQTTCCGVEHTNHEATVSPTHKHIKKTPLKYLSFLKRFVEAFATYKTLDDLFLFY